MRTSVLLLALGSLSATALAQSGSTEIQRIVEEGKRRNQVMRTLHALTYTHGPRLTGSPKLYGAQLWAAEQFRKYGLRNVRLEKWGDVPVGFQRGARQFGRMVEPFESPIVFTTPNWSPGTNGRVRAQAALMPADMADFERRKESLKGKWIVMPQPATMRGVPLSDDELKKAVDSIGIAGRVWGAPDERVHSHGNWQGKTYDSRPTDVNIIVRRSDFDRITRNIRFGRPTSLELEAENLWFKGPVPQYNVVADLPGVERPDEMVIVCGHLDSWNSPGSQGACDNGTGSAVVIEAARILAAAKVKPKRTIRFILWSGEEQGLLGSRAYVEMHKDELPKISAVLNDDGGTNYQGGYTGLEIMRPIMEAAFAPTVAAFPDLPMKFTVVPQMPQGGSSDHAPFNWEGVPGFFTHETGRADYGKVWHTQFDRYEEAIPEYLVQSSTNHALVSFSLANAPSLLPRGPKPDRRNGGLAAQQTEPPAGADVNYFDPHHACNHEDDYVLELADRARRFTLRWMAGRTR